MRVNVYARDFGWLFEDLKRHFERVRVNGTKVVASVQPLSSADTWVALRTNEAEASPDRRRTAVCIHDLFDDGMYLPGGMRQGVRGAGAFVMCHPEQRRILQRSGIPLEGVPMLERPLGALSIFGLRSTMPDRFCVGWVGRNHWRKRLHWFEKTLLCPGTDTDGLSAALIGEGLQDAADRLRQRGIDCLHFPRKEYSVFEYPQLYELLDCLIITSSTEAGPLPLFEALATGLPVLSTPVGWASFFARKSPRYVRIAEHPRAIRSQLEQIRREREALFEERSAIARLVEGWRLEAWLVEVILLAASLADRDRFAHFSGPSQA